MSHRTKEAQTKNTDSPKDVSEPTERTNVVDQETQPEQTSDSMMSKTQTQGLENAATEINQNKELPAVRNTCK
jgi:hypothetical protein